MPSSKYERSIYQLTLKPGTKPHYPDVPKVEFSDILTLLKGVASPLKSCSRLIANGRIATDAEIAGTDPRNSIWIGDWSEDLTNNTVTILVLRGDPSEVNPSLVTPEKGQVQSVPVADDQAPGRSAHVMIKTTPDDKGNYRALLEKTEGLGRSVIFTFFDHLIGEFVYKDPKYRYTPQKYKKSNATKYKTEPYSPRFQVSAPPSASLTDDLKEGVVENIDFIKHDVSNYGKDFDKEFVPKVAKLTVSVQHQTSGEKIKSFVKKQLNNYDYDEAQIKIRELPGEKSASPRVSVEKMEAQDLLYSRLQVVKDFENPLNNACESSINTNLTDRMASVFEEGRW